MRIVAGKFKGITLYEPKDKKTRPLKDMVKESIFNFLNHSNKISFQLEKANVLDLYSGTGSFGLECMSRQAAQVIFIEKEKEATKILEKNIEKLKVKDETKIFFGDVFYVIKKHDKAFSDWPPDMKFDLIFCDPPFKNLNIEKLIQLVFNNHVLHKEGILILHRNKNTKEKLPNYYKIFDEKIYGISKVTFGKFLS